MATLVLRTVKGTPLTNDEVDGNFANLNTELGVVFNRANTINSNVGVLSNLTTTEKSNLVAAINEIATESTTNVTITGGSISNIAGSNVNITSGSLSGVSLSNITASNVSVTGITITSGSLSGVSLSNITASNVSVTGITITSGTVSNVTLSAIAVDDTSTDSTFYPTFMTAASGDAAFKISSTKLTFNPSTGLLTSTDYNSASDLALKENITPIQNALNVIQQLNGFKFTWKETGEGSYGLSAQDVEKIIPEIVKVRPDGFKGINYLNIIALLIESIKDLNKQIQDLRNDK
jgi:hypothetical protein